MEAEANLSLDPSFAGRSDANLPKRLRTLLLPQRLSARILPVHGAEREALGIPEKLFPLKHLYAIHGGLDYSACDCTRTLTMLNKVAWLRI